MKPTTISELCTAMELFVADARKVDLSDLSHEAKLSRLTELSESYGLE